MISNAREVNPGKMVSFGDNISEKGLGTVWGEYFKIIRFLAIHVSK